MCDKKNLLCFGCPLRMNNFVCRSFCVATAQMFAPLKCPNDYIIERSVNVKMKEYFKEETQIHRYQPD